MDRVGGVWLRNRPRRKKIGEKEELSFALTPIRHSSLFFSARLTLAHSLMFHTLNWLRVVSRGLV